MNNRFTTVLFGYKKSDIDRYLHDLKKDYEDELFKKKERLTELNEENRALKLEIENLKKQIREFTKQEECISKALIVAEKNAKAIVEESRQRIKQEMYVIKLEKDKWNRKLKQIRNDMINFDSHVLELIEKFRSELNYYMSKEISETILYDNEVEPTEEGVGNPDETNSFEDVEDVLSELKKVIT